MIDGTNSYNKEQTADEYSAVDGLFGELFARSALCTKGAVQVTLSSVVMTR